jgi:hypothetical protein
MILIKINQSQITLYFIIIIRIIFRHPYLYFHFILPLFQVVLQLNDHHFLLLRRHHHPLHPSSHQ